MDAELVRLLERAWLGEWYGARVYQALADARVEGEEARVLRQLVVLETFVLGELTAVLLALGVDPGPGEMEAVADGDIAEHRDDPWPRLLEWLVADAEEALSEYLPMVDLVTGAPELADVVALVMEHERALAAFGRDSLADVRDPLRHVDALLGLDAS